MTSVQQQLNSWRNPARTLRLWCAATTPSELVQYLDRLLALLWNSRDGGPLTQRRTASQPTGRCARTTQEF